MAAVAGDFRVALKWADDDGRTAFNVIHFKDLAATMTAGDCLSHLLAGPGDVALGGVSGTARVHEIAVTNQFDESDAAVSATGLTLWTGGGGTGDYSIGLSLVLKLHTSRAGRSGRGRMFLPFLTEAAVAKGRITGDVRDLTAGKWIDWHNHLLLTYDLVRTVWSERLETGASVDTCTINPIPGFRRKRANEA